MADLSDFKRGQIVGASSAGTSVTKTAEIFGVTRSNVSKVMTAIEKERKTSSLKQNSGRKRKQYNTDRRTLSRIVRKDHKNTAPKITAEYNDHLENPVSSKTVRWELHKAGFHGELQSGNLFEINLFEIYRFFHYFVHPLRIYIYIYIYIYSDTHKYWIHVIFSYN